MRQQNDNSKLGNYVLIDGEKKFQSKDYTESKYIN